MEQYERFGCCSFWMDCNGGEKCVYTLNLPQKMKACGLYRRYEKGEIMTHVVHSTNFIEDVTNEELIQLSLF